MLRRPILLNRPLKLKKSAIYRPGAKLDISAETKTGAETGKPASTITLRRTPRLAEKLGECRSMHACGNT